MVATGFIAGAKSLLGVVATWNDAILARVARLEFLPDDSTLGRSFKRQNKQTIADMEALPSKIEANIMDRFITSPIIRMNVREEELIDIDGTGLISYGNQEGAVKGFNQKKKGANCYQSLLAFDSISKTVKLAWLQSGNTHCANGTIEFTKQLQALNPERKKFYRLDSGFFSGKAMDEFERQGNGYLVKAKLTKGIKRQFNSIEWSEVPGKYGRKGWQQATFDHACDGWTKERFFSVVRIKVDEYTEVEGLFPDHIIEKYAYFCYICTRKMDPWSIHKFYGQRATCENFIEELKNQMNLGKIRSHNFDATSILFHCAILAYNLLRWMTICSAKKRLISWEISTIRCFLIRVAARMREAANGLIIEISGGHMYQNELDIWMAHCHSS